MRYGVSTTTANAIALCESHLVQNVRGVVNPKDVGLFQINEKYHLAQARKMGIDIYSEAGNIEYAMWLLKKEGTQPWSASKSCWNKPVPGW